MRNKVDIVNQLPDALADEMFEAIHSIMHLYRSRQHRELREGPHDLTHMEGKVLGFFARHPGATQSDLVLHSGRDKAQLARLIRGLRERGLLSAKADEADRRSTRLQLSAQGQRVFKELNAQGARLARLGASGLSEDEGHRLLAALERIRSNLEAEPE